MNEVVIYRVDGSAKKDIPICTIVERRKIERGDNLIGLMRVARKALASSLSNERRYYIKLMGARITF